jgi:serine/threonine protein kinase/tetratricopeptide (TPR) repeat protein
MAVDSKRVKEIFLAVSEVAADGRAALLDRECAGDAELRQRVEALLQAHEEPVSFLRQQVPGRPEQTKAYVPNEQPGAVIAGRYKLLENIGEGGMGTVWVAEQTQPVRRKVALKLIKAGMNSKSVLARFEVERQALAVMDHPNVAKVLDGGLTATGRPFFVMEYVKGVPITDYCDATRLSVHERLQLFTLVCQAVQHAHQKGIIHRDLKPSNILVAPYDDKPVPKIIDFGLAKAMHQPLTERTLHTAHESVLGTPRYMSPEQAQLNNLDVDTRSDIYSLGVLLYELLAGTTPLDGQRFKEAAWDEVCRIIREEEPPRPSKRLSSTNTLPSLAACRHTEPLNLMKQVRGELDWIVMKALEKDRNRRYETANGFARDVQRYLVGEPVLAVPPSATYRLKKLVRRHRGPLLAASVVALALLVGVATVIVVQVRANIELAAKNTELAGEQAKVEARFELAQKAIARFHTGVSEEMLLKNDQLKELRTKLLKEAAGFYADLEKLLAGQTDARSRKALAAGYFQLGELTDKIGSKPEALAVHRKALAVRRELAAAERADVETRLDLAHSLDKVAQLLRATGDNAGALAAFQEQRDLAERLEAEDPTDAARSCLALSHLGTGLVHSETGKPEEAMASYRKALAIRQKLADLNPAVTRFQTDLANSHRILGLLLWNTGKPEEAMLAFRQGLAIFQKLADANPAITEFQVGLAQNHNNIGVLLKAGGKLEEAMVAYCKTLAIFQKVADANPAVTEFQVGLAKSHNNIGLLLSKMGKPEEAMLACGKTVDIYKKLVEANPTVPEYQAGLAKAHNNLGHVLARAKRFAEAFTALDAGLAIRKKLVEAYPKATEYGIHLGYSHAYRGWALVRAGEPSKAAADLRQAVELWFKDPAPDLQTQYQRSQALALLAGLGGEAKSGVTMAETRMFADQAVAALRDAINAGWNQSDELKEPDFDALRGREDFKALLAELEAKAGPKPKPKD